ncbi:MAG: hypothetical protein ACXABY_05025 [Candidatus Thorarchaeota archaeon]|jgi:hypothetical protein
MEDRTELEVELGRLVHEVTVRNRLVKVQDAEIAKLNKQINKINQKLNQIDDAEANKE